MELFETVFQYDYAIRALVASAMVGLMCGLLGCFIVLRNMSLIGDALSHAILPGVVAGFLVAGYSILGFFTGAVIAGLFAAVLITWIQRNVHTQEDAAIGIVFTSMFAIGVMGISSLTRKEGVHLDLKDFLFGNVLGISNQDLWLTFLVMMFTIVCIVAFYRYFFITTFESVVAQTIGISVKTVHYFLMLLLSFAVVASLQSVGVILVVAMLITPASTAYLLTFKMREMLVISGIVGILSTTLGFLLAVAFETTPGPAMTVTATGFYLLAVLFSPKRGLVSRYLKGMRRRERILREDVLKQSVRLHEKGALGLNQLSERLGIKPGKITPALQYLRRKDFLSFSNEDIGLSPKGIEKGYDLIRAHRLWETYLVEKMGLSVDQIHENAEKYEHILTDSLVDEVNEKLGFPELDPHGSPIPPRKGKP
ncbi:metal ABC transporter permease [bacterium]|nr:metal ABC transporter permease [bacterium]